MKIRIGIGASASLTPDALGELGDHIVELGFDSIWLPEILTGATVDPLVGLAWLAGRQPDLKLGTTMLLPGRNLVRLAKAVASLDALSSGRFLVTMVPGIPIGAERQAVGLAPEQRGAIMDEAMPLLRQLWAGDRVDYAGALGTLDGVTLAPLPVQDPFEVWGGGQARSALERCGRLFDGWLPAFCTPEEVAEGREVVDRAADGAGRRISTEHFGVSILYRRTDPQGAAVEILERRLRGRPLDDVVPRGLEALRDLLERFIAVGFSKFVVRPLEFPSRWRDELQELATAVGDLQT